MKHHRSEQAVGHDGGSAWAAEVSPRERRPGRPLQGRAAVSPDPTGRVAIGTAAQPTTPPDGYSDADLCAYAYHVWIQLGMPCAREAWDEAKACLDANLALLPDNRAQPAGGRGRGLS
ncbi:hypothetical protein [Horticoccus sp. 23ND18S-11]|uniref:hypothetical protein n=1 Tax=Horticoccus sp. 23ND18S-11 TaxID=3391832 RepID=UPI0039C9C10D